MTDEITSNGTVAGLFEVQRPRLRAIAYRMLGSHSDAEDAVQETWLRLQRSDADAVDNLTGWLTTVVSRVCLDQLRSRGSRREDLVDELPAHGDNTTTQQDRERSPEDRSMEADAVGAALLVVLETLNPSERLAFVLHDLFGLPFEEIAPIVGKSPAAARQLASRARRRVRGVEPSQRQDRQREVVTAFLAASREGDFGRLLQLLDPEVKLRADPIVVAGANAVAAAGVPAPLLAEHLQGPDAVARVFAGRAQGARVAMIDGVPGAVWAPGGKIRTVFAMEIHDGRITRFEVIGDPDLLRDLAITLD